MDLYKLVSIDMDGTLLNSKGEISDENIQAIKQSLDNGIKVVFTTGRGIKAISKFIEKVGLRDRNEYIIANNGVALYKTNDLKCLRANTLNKDEIKLLVEVGIDLGAKVLIYDYNTETTIVLEDNEFAKFEREHIGMDVTVDPDFLSNMGDDAKAFKIILTSEPSRLDEIQKSIPDHIRERFTVVRTLPIALELFDKNSNKGNAVKELAEIFNISREEIICIGDQQNDMEMVEFAGLGVAMGNAIEPLKKIADYITDTNDNNGVAKVINKFVL